VLDGPVCAQDQEAIVMKGCAPLTDLSTTPTPTGVAVDLLGGALPGGSCTAPFGSVTTFSVAVRGTTISAEDARCGSSVELHGLVPGRPYIIDVTASVGLEAGRASSVQTTCTAIPIAGVVVSAGCDPFRPPTQRDD
jgi:hypothetical protein